MALTKISNNSLSAISTLPASIPTGALTLLSTQTASSSASIEFTSGIDSTYSSYVFKFIDIHPTDGNYTFGCQFSTDGGSTYATTVTSTYFWSYHLESDGTGFGYNTGLDQAQGTGTIFLNSAVSGASDGNACGTLQLFNPSSTTFVKHFIVTGNHTSNANISTNGFIAGYCNTTSALTNIRFKASSGNIDDGKILCFGLN